MSRVVIRLQRASERNAACLFVLSTHLAESTACERALALQIPDLPTDFPELMPWAPVVAEPGTALWLAVEAGHEDVGSADDILGAIGVRAAEPTLHRRVEADAVLDCADRLISVPASEGARPSPAVAADAEPFPPPVRPNTWEITHLFVSRAARGRGIAHRLLHVAMAHARSHPHPHTHADAHTHTASPAQHAQQDGAPFHAADESGPIIRLLTLRSIYSDACRLYARVLPRASVYTHAVEAFDLLVLEMRLPPGPVEAAEACTCALDVPRSALPSWTLQDACPCARDPVHVCAREGPCTCGNRHAREWEGKSERIREAVQAVLRGAGRP